MSAISLKSISGITSITTPAGVDNQFTLHNNNTTEAVKLDTAGNFHFHNHVNTTGISTASNFKTGTSNLHSTGLNIFDLDVDGHTNLDNVSIAGVSTIKANAVDTDVFSIIRSDSSSTKLFRIFQDSSSGGGAGGCHINTTNRNLMITANVAAGADDGLYLTTAGSIGINSTSPDRRFTLHQDATCRMNLKSLSNSTAGIEFGDEADHNAGYVVYDNTNNSFQVGLNGTGEKLRITSDGKMSLGTSIHATPAAALHIDNDTNNMLMLDNSTSSTQKIFFANNASTHAQIFGTTASGGLTFDSDPSNSHNSSSIVFKVDGSTKMLMNSSGNLGIGIADPDQQLEVNGIIKGGSYFQGGASGTASNNWHFGAEGNGEFRFYTGNYGAGDLKQKISSNGDVLPGANNTSDLGSGSLRWRNVYTTDLQLSNEGKTNDVDGTWGNYTIQEGESDLFLINNRNGKKYVFLLKEVS